MPLVYHQSQETSKSGIPKSSQKGGGQKVSKKHEKRGSKKGSKKGVKNRQKSGKKTRFFTSWSFSLVEEKNSLCLWAQVALPLHYESAGILLQGPLVRIRKNASCVSLFREMAYKVPRDKGAFSLAFSISLRRQADRRPASGRNGHGEAFI